MWYCSLGEALAAFVHHRLAVLIGGGDGIRRKAEKASGVQIIERWTSSYREKSMAKT